MKETELNPDDPVVRTAVRGKIVEDFFSGEVGKILGEYAKDKVDTYTEELKTTYPLRIFKIMKLQNQIEVWEGFQQALANAIIDGLNATKLLEDDHG